MLYSVCGLCYWVLCYVLMLITTVYTAMLLIYRVAQKNAICSLLLNDYVY